MNLKFFINWYHIYVKYLDIAQRISELVKEILKNMQIKKLYITFSIQIW